MKDAARKVEKCFAGRVHGFRTQATVPCSDWHDQLHDGLRHHGIEPDIAS